MGKMTIGQMVAQLAGGMLISTQIFVITLMFSLPLGLIVAFGRLSKNRVISMIVKFYISIMRGTPLMLQLMVVYFGPYYLFHIKVGSGYRLTASAVSLVVFTHQSLPDLPHSPVPEHKTSYHRWIPRPDRL